MATYAPIPAQPTSTTQVPKVNVTLNSWKEIAVFLGRGIRTAQRWELDLDLPVHRVRNTARSPVFAFHSELRIWLHSHCKAEITDLSVCLEGQTTPSSQLRSVTRMRTQQLAARMRELLLQQIRHTEQLRHKLESTTHAVNYALKKKRC